jgi:hypothetical protein
MSAATSLPPSATDRREARRHAKAHVARLRAALEEAKRRHKMALTDARERCRSERLAVRERTRALRLRVLAELRDTTRMERQAARDACKLRLREARSLRNDEAQARASFAAERKFQKDLHAAERAHHARKKSVAAVCGCAGEGAPTKTDIETAAASLPSDLAMVYERVRHELPKSDRSVETFLRHVEKHPEKLLEATQHPAHVHMKALEAEHAQAKKALNPYEQKKAARIERMKARAERLQREAEATHARAHSIASMIPMGQPILVGHHSERRHRRDINRIDHGLRRSFALQERSEKLAERAKYAESNRAISSDDPDAIPKLEEKLRKLEASRARMVEANKAVRSNDPKAGLKTLGFSEGQVKELLTSDFSGSIGFPSYALTNNAHEAARIKKRIEVLKAQATAPAKPAVVGPGVRIDEAENRVRIFFDAKPPVEMRTALKGAGFRWAPSVGAWQRHASGYAWDDAKRITKATATEPAAPTPATSATPAAKPMLAREPARPIKNFVRSPANTNVLRGTVRNLAEEERAKALAAKHAAQPKPKGAERLDTAEIAALIRADIKGAVKRGELPKTAKYSVTTDKYSMGSSITVKASALAFRVINPGAYVVEHGANYMTLDRTRHKSRFTPRAQLVLDKLEEIVNAYHWDRSDPMSDVYNERFARHVSVEHAKDEYADIEKEKLAEARARRGY